MADELSVVIKTKLEIDEQQARQELDKFGSSYSSSNNGSAIKLPVDIDEKPSNANVSSFISTLSQSLSSKPVQAVLGINEAESLKRISSSITAIQNKLKSKELKIDVGVNATSGSSKNKSSKSPSTISGIDYSEIAGAEKYVNRLVEKAKQFESSFTDAAAKIASTDIAYKPLEKMWQATVKYEDSIGRTTAMMFSMNEGMEEINVTQLKLTENAKQQRHEIEKTLDYLNKQETAYKDLFSKAFDQKNKLTDDKGNLDSFGLIAMGALDNYKKKIDEIKKSGAAFTDDQRRELETLRADATRVIREQQTAKLGAVAKEVEFEYEKLMSYLKKYEKIDVGEIVALDKLYASAGQANPLLPELGAIGSIDELNKWRAEVKLAKVELESFFQTAHGKALNLSFDVNENQINTINRLLSSKGIASGTTDGVVRLRKELQDILAEYAKVQASLKTGVFDDSQLQDQIADLDKLDQRLSSASKSAKLFNDSLSSENAIIKASSQIEKLHNDLDKIEVDWSKALEIPELKADIDNLRAALNNADAISLPNVQKSFTELRSKIRAAGADCKSFGGQLMDAFGKLKSYFGVTEVFQYAKEVARDMVDAVKEIDTAMIELKKVTDLSASGYDKFTKEAAQRSRVIGTDLVDYIASTADFARLGYGADDAQTLSESTNILYKVGDGLTNIDQASDAVIASMAAYGLKVSDVTSIVDKFNEVSNKTSIDTAGLTEAITRSASALAVTGLDLDKSLALIVAGNETTRNASATGTALKSLSLRIRGAETDLKDMGEETDEYTKSTSKLREEIETLTGVDIMVNDSQFKDLYDIMDEISAAYKNLTDIDRANVTEILFGKQRASVGASVLLNFDKAEKALYAAQNSTGSAMAEHERWAQSIEAAEQRAATAFQEFSVTVMNSELVKGVYDAGAGILGFLTNIIEKLGAIPVLAATVASALSLKNIGISKMNMPYPTRRSAVA